MDNLIIYSIVYRNQSVNMRIKHLSKITSINNDLYATIAVLIFFAAIDIYILLYALISQSSLVLAFKFLFISFLESVWTMKIIYLLIFLIPLLMLYLLINELNKKKNFNPTGLIKYIDFKDDKIILSYYNTSNVDTIYYSNIYYIEFVFDTDFCNTGAMITGIQINVKSNKLSFSVNSPFDVFRINDLCKLVFYTQYIKNFSYRYTGNGIEAQNYFSEIIEEYINNNYKKSVKILYRQYWQIIVAFLFISSILIIVHIPTIMKIINK